MRRWLPVSFKSRWVCCQRVSFSRGLARPAWRVWRTDVVGTFGWSVPASPSFSGSPRSFAPPSGSVFQGQPGTTPILPSDKDTGVRGPGPSPRQERAGVGYRGPYVYAGYPWLIPFGYGLPFRHALSGMTRTRRAAPKAPQQADHITSLRAITARASGPEVAANTPSPFRPTYQGQIEAAPVHPQPATTLIFKDGRPPAQVHNYALTASTLYALDGDSRQEIPLSLLNVPATVEANRKAGVDFALPVSR